MVNQLVNERWNCFTVVAHYSLAIETEYPMERDTLPISCIPNMLMIIRLCM